ncbi:hypothetical protein GCM10020367_44290 [Streptomyces sannanensis]|uniref:JmjC domain-containing protein n=1 Tax=Streptomyces sannanensis TaxID=285536 RepID=A0ABP6SGK4_9ACTN
MLGRAGTAAFGTLDQGMCTGAVPMYRDSDPNNTPSDEIIWSGVMRTGDVMHIPRGHWHQTTRTGSGSGKNLHVTFGITKRTGASWLAWLADWCREHEIFRHDLDRRHGPDSEALIEAATTLVGERSPSDFLTAYEQETTLPRHVPFLDILGPLEPWCAPPTSHPGSRRTERPSTSCPQGRSSPSRPRPCPRCGCC